MAAPSDPHAWMTAREIELCARSALICPPCTTTARMPAQLHLTACPLQDCCWAVARLFRPLHATYLPCTSPATRQGAVALRVWGLVPRGPGWCAASIVPAPHSVDSESTGAGGRPPGSVHGCYGCTPVHSLVTMPAMPMPLLPCAAAAVKCHTDTHAAVRLQRCRCTNCI